MKITTIGLDLAKSVFHVVCFDEKHRETSKRMLRRNQMREYFAQLEPCRVAMEACAGAHYRGGALEKRVPPVRLIPPQFVKPYVKCNKNDYNDARAIAEAAHGRGCGSSASRRWWSSRTSRRCTDCVSSASRRRPRSATSCLPWWRSTASS
ncbi:MAG: transposase [Gammaproteobacteria bacterium]|nr:transposase [Gammaproteobacteria bacterium]